MEYEGEDDEDPDSIFENLIIDIESELDLNGPEDSAPTNYFTIYRELIPEEASTTSVVLANKLFRYLLIKYTPNNKDKPNPFSNTLVTDPKSRYDKEEFMGILIDTGASIRSTAGYNQLQALLRSEPGLEIDTSTQVEVVFGIGTTTTIGTVTLHTLIGDVQFHIVHAVTPFLLSLADMDRLGVYYNNTRDVLVINSKEIPAVRRFGHAFLIYGPSLQTYVLDSLEMNPCYLTETELRRLYRRFGHPLVERLHKILDRAGHDVDRKTLNHLTKYCNSCQKFGRSLGRFRFTLRDDLEFNYCIIVDIIYISGSPVLYVVDESIRF
jgi:hypothetical protein